MDPQTQNQSKLNWKRILDEIPEVHDIIATGDMGWVKESKHLQFPVCTNDFDK